VVAQKLFQMFIMIFAFFVRLEIIRLNKIT